METQFRLVYSAGGWRRLEPGEVIKEGDQVRVSKKVWVDSAQAGERAPTQYAAEYRRRIQRKTPSKKD